MVDCRLSVVGGVDWKLEMGSKRQFPFSNFGFLTPPAIEIENRLVARFFLGRASLKVGFVPRG